MALLRDTIPVVLPKAFEPQPLHIPATSPSERGLFERGEAPAEEVEPGEGQVGTNVFEIDIS